jgi:hypothetical protein
MKAAPILILPLLAVLLTGCGGLIPIPPVSHQIEYGRAITAGQIKFIVPGRTTQAEVVARLGCDFRDSPRVSALAYSWQYNGTKVAWWYFLAWGDFAAGDGGIKDVTGWQAFFVAFDQAGRVTEFEFHNLNHPWSLQQTLDEQLEDWAQRHGAASITGTYTRN